MLDVFGVYNIITAIIIGAVLAAFFYFIFSYFLFEFLPMKIAAGEPIFLRLVQDPQSVMNALNSNMTLVPVSELEDPTVTELRAQTLEDIANKERRRKWISILFASIIVSFCSPVSCWWNSRIFNIYYSFISQLPHFQCVLDKFLRIYNFACWSNVHTL